MNGLVSVAQLGPLTAFLESLATAIGAGMLLGSFGVGAVGVIAGRPRRALEERVLTDGYFGGLLGLGATVIDLLVRYIW